MPLPAVTNLISLYCNANTMPTQTKLRHKIILSVSGIICSLILIEACMSLWGFLLVQNRQRRLKSALAHKADYRILCLGESTTENQYPPYLEAILNQNAAGVKFKVIDQGMAATNSEYLLANLNDYLTRYRPDMVITMVGINDCCRVRNIDIFSNRTLTTPALLLLLKQSHLYKLAAALWVNIESKFYRLKQGWDLSAGAAPFAIDTISNQINFGALKKEYAAILRRDPKNSTIWSHLGWCYYWLGSDRLAEKAYKNSLAIDKNNCSSFIGLGRLYARQNNLRAAEEACARAVVSCPSDARAYSELGHIYRREKKLALAEKMFRSAIRLNRNEYRAERELARILRYRDNPREARALYEHLLLQRPQDVKIRLEFANFCRIKKRFTDAESVLKATIRINPKIRQAYYLLSLLFLDEGNKALAAEYGQKAEQLRETCEELSSQNYNRIKEIVQAAQIQLVCVQYPLRKVQTLKDMLAPSREILFVDNERSFQEAVERDGYRAYFWDTFAGDFGHCTEKGNRLLAGNIAAVILKAGIEK